MLVATRNFKGIINGEAVSLKKGAEFKGSNRAAERLKKMGLLEKSVRKAPKKEA